MTTLIRLTLLLMILSPTLASPGSVIDTPPEPDPESTAPLDYTPTDRYERRTLLGWPILINPELDTDPTLKARTLRLLEDHLYRITRKIPPSALNHLRSIPIWVERDMPKTACMCYHVSRDWLIPNGYNPDKEGAVEVGNAAAFLEWTQGQPWMVLHELAHGYHDQVFGFDDPEIAAAWQARVDAGDFDSVLHISGATRRHYGLTNPMEYFAETTESFFGCNDFYPFVRGELMQADPRGVELMKATWFRKVD